MKNNEIIKTLLCSLLMSGAASGRTILVPTEQALTIQDGINQAVNGDSVLIMNGTYTGPKNRNLDFKGKEIRVASKNGQAAKCIIDCQRQGRGFVFQRKENNKSMLLNVTIQNGYAAAVGGVGGGIACMTSSPTIAGCIIRGNQAAAPNTADCQGGGIFCDNSSPVIQKCSMWDNCGWEEPGWAIESQGGGIACVNKSAPRLEHCDISGNNVPDNEDVTGNGGGVLCDSESKPLITGCTINSNRAMFGAGIFALSSVLIVEHSEIANNAISEWFNWGHEGGGGILARLSAAQITDCFIHDNWAGPAGGGIDCEESLFNISLCTISNNYGETYGGGIMLYWSSGDIYDCKILNNTADYAGGGIDSIFHSSSRIHKCLIAENTVTAAKVRGNGGGVGISGAGSEMVDCEIYDNRVRRGLGGGVAVFDDNVQITDCIIASNSATFGGGVECGQQASPTIRHCLINNNMADSGGGVQCDYASAPLITGCLIEQNNVDVAPRDIDYENGAEYLRQSGGGGGIACSNSAAMIVDSGILENRAVVGGGVYCYYGRDKYGEPSKAVYAPTFRNCTISQNQASWLGSALYCWKNTTREIDSVYLNISNKLQLLNTIIWGNAGMVEGRQVGQTIGATKKRPLFQVEYCDLQGGVPAIRLVDDATVDTAAPAANISQNPLLTDGVHITDRSPCVDRGNSAWVQPGETDVDGDPRIQGFRVDIGADEIWRPLIGKPPLQTYKPGLDIPRQFPEWLVDIWQDLLKKPFPKPEPPPTYVILPVDTAVESTANTSVLAVAPINRLAVEQVKAAPVTIALESSMSIQSKFMK